MNSILLSDNWKPATDIQLEKAALAAVKSDCNLAIVAGPGAGKTELLAHRAGYLLQTKKCEYPRKILAISFKVDAAKNLETRVKERYGEEISQRFDSKTFDSFAKHLVDRFRNALPTEYRPSRDYEIISTEREVGEIAKTYITEENPYFPNWEYFFSNKELFKALHNSKLPLVQVKSDLYNWLSSSMWSLLIHGKGDLKSSLTFPMISRLAEYLLRVNPYILSALQCTYSHVFLDEFQDTTNTQYDLLKTAFLNSDTILTAVGDNKQRIMGWANALNDATSDFIKDFNGTQNQLIMNHRSAPKLVEIQNVLAQRITENCSLAKVSNKWGELEGLCEIWAFEHYQKEADYLAEKISTWINTNGLQPRDICILVKQQELIYGKSLISALSKKNIQARIEKEYQELLSEDCVHLFLNIFSILADAESSKAWLNIVSLLSTIRGIQDNQNNEVFNLEIELQVFIEQLQRDINTFNFEKDTLCLNIEKVLRRIIDFIGDSNFKCYFPYYQKDKYLTAILQKFSLKLAIAYIETKDWYKAIKEFLGDYSIPIMTIHKSKGLEYDTVIFVGLEDDAFWSFKTQTQADTCAFFVALSRAKKQVIFTFSQYREIKKMKTLSTERQSVQNISELYKILLSVKVPIKKIGSTI
ncbi:UvrD-helicase domain-containing protein [Bacillus thuringiensis]|uniref:UvrD-helicase domain-containing protein n=1 Tax=Bacillus cereus group TaxID=86661 RepID=UPI0001A2086A|nr:ATP-dependent helicase [Bacillus thuringiensis]EEM81328.1 DNA helicase [Bacillus thuringiensis serovar huazhongensis BGSC 4BD1]